MIYIFIIFLFLLILKSVNLEINRDENQFFSAIILTRDFDLLPYKDYNFAHTPYLIYFYSILKLTNYDFLNYRIISTFISILIPLVISLKFYFKNKIYGILVFTIIVSNSIFLQTSYYIWNHQLSSLFVILAFLLFRIPFLSGFMIGLAVGVRLSSVFMIFPLIILLHKERRKYFILGFLISILPIFLFFITSRESFTYGVITYNLYLNPKFYGFADKTLLEILLYKILTFLRLILKYNYEVLILSILLLILERKKELLKQSLILIFAAISCLLPTPIFNQYLYLFIIVFLYLAFKKLFEKNK